MTRDARSERYATVDDILDDIDKLEGMDSLLGRQNQVLVGESPLSSIKFRPGAEEPLAGTPVEAARTTTRRAACTARTRSSSAATRRSSGGPDVWRWLSLRRRALHGEHRSVEPGDQLQLLDVRPRRDVARRSSTPDSSSSIRATTS